ncbi:MAG: hypothetical protein ACXVQ6_11390 [Actinomycetota bacterium]
MKDVRRTVARVLESHLDEILDVTMDALVREVPAVARQSDDIRGLVRASTRQATLAFLALYANPSTPRREMLDQARRATVDRAGETFQRDEILSIIGTARQMIFQLGRTFVHAECGDLGDESEVEISEALASFLTELEREDEKFVPRRDPVEELLRSAEREGPDLT